MFDFCTSTVTYLMLSIVDNMVWGDLAKLALTFVDIDRFY